MRHLQRGEDFPGTVLIQCGSGHTFHQRAQRDEVRVAVEKARAGRIHRLLGEGQTVAGVPALPGRIQIKIFTQTGEVCQEVANSDVVFPILGEFRKVLCYGIVYPDLALLHQLHYSRGGSDNFGE